jgi:hypothetical protein
LEAVSIATAIIVDGTMVLIFFLIHKYYWQPHRRGEPAFGGIFQSLQNFVHEHDFFRKPVQTTAVILVAFCVVICAVLMGITLAVGETDLSKMVQTSEEAEGVDVGFLETLVESSEIRTDSAFLSEGAESVYTNQSEKDKYFKQVQVTITWTDEPDSGGIFLSYENQPDTFTIVIDGPNASVEKSGSNPIGGEGRVSAELSFTLEELAEIISSEGEEYEVTITIIMTEAGNQEHPLGLEQLEIEDEGNNYTYEIEIIWLVPE